MVEWFRKIFKRDKGMNVQKLTDITRGMHHAVSTTSAMLAQQYILMVNQFFDRDTDEKGETIFKAKMATVEIDDKHHMKLPLVSLLLRQLNS